MINRGGVVPNIGHATFLKNVSAEVSLPGVNFGPPKDVIFMKFKT